MMARTKQPGFPQFIAPMLATLTDQREFPGPRGKWLFERKLDGFRALAFRHDRGVRLLSRNQLDFGPNYPELLKALQAQPLDDFIIDGEIVALYRGQVSFQHLQQFLQTKSLSPVGRGGRGGVEIAYYVFDLLRAGGHDIRQLPLRERKRLLKQVIAFEGPIRYTPHRIASAVKAFRDACRHRWEGLIAKDADAPYISGRSKRWLKLKCEARQEFVIGGYSDPQGSRIVLGALLVGYFEAGKLRYAGKVGTGYSQATLRMLGSALAPLIIDSSRFAPDPALPRRGVHWVKPKLVAEVQFTEWTQDGKLRHPQFMGLRPDKSPTKVVRERPQR